MKNVVICCARTKSMVGQMAADHSIAVKSRHQSLHVFIISKLQFTIYIIKKKINATTTSTTTSMSHKSINARSMIQSKKKLKMKEKPIDSNIK